MKPEAPRLQILHLDDELAMPLALRQAFERTLGCGSVRYSSARTLAEFLSLCAQPRFLSEEFCLLVDLDLGASPSSGIDAMEQALRLGVTGPAIILSGNDDTRLMSQAIRRGAWEYLSKAEPLAVLVERILKAVDHWKYQKSQRARFELELESGGVRAEGDDAHGLARGGDASHPGLGGAAGETMAQVAETLKRVVSRRISPVLVRGESGTGKERVANIIESLLEDAHQPFVRINCASLHEETMESELFGHEKGAFTGADRAKVGLFESAHQGWIFLDEVAKLSARAQANLLRVLETGEIRPLGSTTVRMLKFCVVAATNEDLDGLAEQGLFRLDLLERLRAFSITLPPLRERSLRERMVLLRVLLQRLSRETGSGVEYHLDAAAQHMILNAPFQRSNVRELWNLLQAAAVSSEDGVIGIRCLPAAFLEEQARRRRAPEDLDSQVGSGPENGVSKDVRAALPKDGDGRDGAGVDAGVNKCLDFEDGYVHMELRYFSSVLAQLSTASPEHVRSVRSLAVKLKLGRHLLTRKLKELDAAGLVPLNLRHLVG